MSQTKNQSRLEFLDGIRAMAAMWIVFSHVWAFEHSGSRTLGGWVGFFTNWLTGYNHFAVDVFIVLSGFCLILPVVRTGELAGGTLHFFKRRARRILPPYFAALVFSALLAYVIERAGRQPAQQLTAASLWANLLLLQDVFPARNTINAPFWSVALECKIYLFFPLLLWVRRRAGWPAVVASAAAVGYGLMAAVWWLAPGFHQNYSCPWYLLLFAMGAAAGWFANRPIDRVSGAIARIGVIGFGALLAICLWRWPIGRTDDAAFIAHLPLIDTAVGGLTASALWFLARAPAIGFWARVRSMCQTRPLVAVGLRSYSLYLIHLPCLFAARIAVNRIRALQGSPWRLLVIAAIGLPVVAVITAAFFKAFEKPFLSSAARKRSDRSEPAPAATGDAGGVATEAVGVA